MNFFPIFLVSNTTVQLVESCIHTHGTLVVKDQHSSSDNCTHNSYPSSELVNNEEKYMAIRDALKPIRSKDSDKLIAWLSTSDKHPVGGPSGNARGASVRVEQIMTLRSAVPGLPEVVRALNGCHSYLLRMLGDLLDDERVKSTNDMVSQELNDDALSAGGGGSFGTSFGSVTKKVYAV
ncbi:MutS family domain IV, partial [Rhizoctonia solani]